MRTASVMHVFWTSTVIVPIIARIRGWSPYPHTADALHALNWILLVGAFHAFRFRNVTDRRDAILLGYGFGAITIVWWEVMEWAVSEDGFGGAGGLALTYEDTIGDLQLSSTGGLLGSIIGVIWLGPRH